MPRSSGQCCSQPFIADTCKNNYQGTATVTFNDHTLGNENLNVPFTFITDGGNDGKAYAQVNGHVNRVTSDYMMYYDVTSLAKSGVNKATVHTEPTIATSTAG